MGTVIPFKPKATFQSAANQVVAPQTAGKAAIPTPMQDIGYHEFLMLRSQKNVLLYRSEHGAIETVDWLLMYREKARKEGRITAEMYLKDIDYIYQGLCRNNASISFYDDSMRMNTLALRYDEETFTPILRDARMKYMRENFSVTPGSNL